MSTASPASAVVMTPEELLEHWQGHRNLTRRMIEAYPEDQLYSFSLGGMRPFGMLVLEMLTMAVPMVQGVLTNEWNASFDREAMPKDALLQAWDAATEELNTLWPQIPGEKFQEHIVAFGMYPGKTYGLILYVIDNEIHHRGQGYVYMRALGIEPPPFYER